MGDSYPGYLPCDSNRGWHREWFYIKNPVATPFPVFTDKRPEKKESRSWGYAKKEKHKVGVIEAELWKLVKSGLNGVWVFHTLYRHRVMPLAERVQPMWMYDGLMDSDRTSLKDLPDDEV